MVLHFPPVFNFLGNTAGAYPASASFYLKHACFTSLPSHLIECIGSQDPYIGRMLLLADESTQL